MKQISNILHLYIYLLHGAINCINTQLKSTERAIDCSLLQFADYSACSEIYRQSMQSLSALAVAR